MGRVEIFGEFVLLMSALLLLIFGSPVFANCAQTLLMVSASWMSAAVGWGRSRPAWWRVLKQNLSSCPCTLPWVDGERHVNIYIHVLALRVVAIASAVMRVLGRYSQSMLSRSWGVWSGYASSKARM